MKRMRRAALIWLLVCGVVAANTLVLSAWAGPWLVRQVAFDTARIVVLGTAALAFLGLPAWMGLRMKGAMGEEGQKLGTTVVVGPLLVLLNLVALVGLLVAPPVRAQLPEHLDWLVDGDRPATTAPRPADASTPPSAPSPAPSPAPTVTPSPAADAPAPTLAAGRVPPASRGATPEVQAFRVLPTDSTDELVEADVADDGRLALGGRFGLQHQVRLLGPDGAHHRTIDLDRFRDLAFAADGDLLIYGLFGGEDCPSGCVRLERQRPDGTVRWSLDSEWNAQFGERVVPTADGGAWWVMGLSTTRRVGEQRIGPPPGMDVHRVLAVTIGDDGRVRDVHVLAEGRLTVDELAATDEGGLVLAGRLLHASARFGGEPLVNAGTDDDVWLGGVAADGSPTFHRVLGTRRTERLRDLSLTPDGDIVIAGASQAPGLDLGGGVLPFGSHKVHWLARYRPDGTHAWSWSTTAPIAHVAVRGDGDLLVSGTAYSSMHLGIEPHPEDGVDAMWAGRLTPDGRPVWSRRWSAVRSSSRAVLAAGERWWLVGRSHDGVPMVDDPEGRWDTPHHDLFVVTLEDAVASAPVATPAAGEVLPPTTALAPSSPEPPAPPRQDPRAAEDVHFYFLSLHHHLGDDLPTDAQDALLAMDWSHTRHASTEALCLRATDWLVREVLPRALRTLGDEAAAEEVLALAPLDDLADVEAAAVWMGEAAATTARNLPQMWMYRDTGEAMKYLLRLPDSSRPARESGSHALRVTRTLEHAMEQLPEEEAVELAVALFGDLLAVARVEGE